jgi:hypothetical protein
MRMDASFYAAATISAVFFTSSLNNLLPEGGIPDDVMATGWLCWMLAFGSFFTWRDRTLLFQAVPTIALFGLIGCYDTYAPAPFLFFGFLLCLATLLGRSHSREMLRMAVMSGYFNRADSPSAPSEQPEQSSELYEDIKRGPWRWLAGPEWALLSGLVIVVFSVLGAPIIRQAVAPLSNSIRNFAPRRGLRNTPASTAPSSTDAYTVGRGPLPNPTGILRPEFLAKLDKMRYLRSSVFENYDSHGWYSSQIGDLTPVDTGLGPAAISEMAGKKKFHITVIRVTPSDTIPLPVETFSIAPNAFVVTQSGSARCLDSHIDTVGADGFDATGTPVTASRDLRPQLLASCLENSTINPNVIDFARKAAANSDTDYAKAQAICIAIGRRCKYYRGASAVPQDRDAADYFLNTSKLGYCDLFATAMVECARAVDIPAHFVIGYLPDAKNTDRNGATTIYQDDYHAWAELYFKDVGWVVFDATEGAETLQVDSQFDTSKFAKILTVAIDVLIGAGLAVSVVGLIHSRLKGSSRKSSKADRTEIRKIYLGFTQAIYRATRLRRELYETADEYLARVLPALPNSGKLAQELNLRFASAMYGPNPPDDRSFDLLRSELKNFKSSLRSNAPLKVEAGRGV